MSDLIDRQAAIDAVNNLTYPSSLVDVKRILVDLPPVQTELYKDDVSRQAVKYLDLFTKAYCRDKTVKDGLVFRCKQCEFEMPDGKCLVKVMARKLCPDYNNFGAMGDL